MEKSCKDTEHVLTRYVVFKGEKSISKQFTEKDCCQFCKEQLGEGVFYCKFDQAMRNFPLFKPNLGKMQVAQSVTKDAMTSVVNATFEEQVAKTGLTVCSGALLLGLRSSPRTTSKSFLVTTARNKSRVI